MLEAVYLACTGLGHSAGEVGRLAGDRPAAVILATNTGTGVVCHQSIIGIRPRHGWFGTAFVSVSVVVLIRFCTGVLQHFAVLLLHA